MKFILTFLFQVIGIFILQANQMPDVSRLPAGIFFKDCTPVFTGGSDKSGAEKSETLKIPAKSLSQVFTNANDELRKIELAEILPGKLLIRLTFKQKTPDYGMIRIYLDRDGNPNTGRKGSGMDMLLVAQEGNRHPYGYEYYWTKNGKMRNYVFKTDCRINQNTITFLGNIQLKNAGKNQLVGRMQVFSAQGRLTNIFSFKINKTLPVSISAKKSYPKKIGIEISGGTLSFQQIFAKGKIHVHSKISKRNRAYIWQIRVKNLDKKERFIRIGIQRPFKFMSSWQFWNGWDLTARNKPDTINWSGYSAAFPMACVYADSGFAIGLTPCNLVSKLENGITRNPGKKSPCLYFSIPVALFPGREEFLEFTVFPFRQSCGHLDAVERYYDLFPEAFQPASQTNKYLRGIGLNFLYWRNSFNSQSPNNCADLIRRLTCGNGGWEWGYTYHFPGDWGMAQKVNWPKRHQKTLAEKYGNPGKCLTAAAWYCNPQWCEQAVTGKSFPDAIFDLGKHPNDVFTHKWRGGTITTVKLYPDGNSWGESLRESFKFIAETYSPAAFGFDSVCGIVKDYGPASHNSPGRTFDSDLKSYNTLGVGYARLMDYTHMLTNGNGRKVGVVSNLKLAGTFQEAFRSDTFLYEGLPPADGSGLYPRFYRLRMLCGGKSSSWIKQLSKQDIPGVNWNNFRSGEFKKALRKFNSKLINCSLHLGMLPGAALISGNQEIYQMMPILEKISNLGWRPSPQSTVNGRGKLALTRFGGMYHGAFTIVNFTGNCAGASLSVIKNGGYYILSDGLEKQKIVRNIITPSGTKIDIPSNISDSYAVFLKSAWVKGLASGDVVNLKCREIENKTVVLELCLKKQRASDIVVVVPPPDCYWPETVTVDGKNVATDYDQLNRICRFKLSAALSNKIEVSFKPDIIISGNIRELARMPFFVHGNISIVANGLEGQKYGWPAWRLQKFFSFYAENVLEMKKALDIQVVDYPKQATGKIQIILQEAGLSGRIKGEIRISKKRIVIRSSRKYFCKTVLFFLSLLDRKYQYFGKLIFDERIPDYLGKKLRKRQIMKEVYHLPRMVLMDAAKTQK